ncbi:uncharacterized protein LY89DRAFT_777069 [Mollisia scopiformis]|uniref:linoleate 8R-lipoxygenase n=1 Tax=Mollisia scopiformis TaxID=149040 RepID=A0A194XSL0_MOLSC|nr:uncharacterized protein LY89DRAFT_777069 [Mollisia scopiformis]KUJ23290.1 hypothetical protein LY89DRAFT_777069 [Mollisia scopiformis]
MVKGILQARKWPVASLNDVREFFGLKRYEKMEEVNSDPEIADLLRKLYHDPDMIELYPGLLVEDPKPAMSPGHGACLNFTLGRAVLSDAITLVRSDRFSTIDYTPATLTNWGFDEIRADPKTLGGSMFYKLIQRVPGWFQFNSIHVMQPFYTKNTNEKIAKDLGTLPLYTTADPAPPSAPIPVTKNTTVRSIFKDPAHFAETVGFILAGLFPIEKRDFSAYMLAGDSALQTAQRNLVGDILYGSDELKTTLTSFLTTYGSECLIGETLSMANNLDQIDIMRDLVQTLSPNSLSTHVVKTDFACHSFAIPVSTRLIADLWNLDMQTPENPDGAISMIDIRTALTNLRAGLFASADTATIWNHRRLAQEGATLLTETTDIQVNNVLRDNYHVGWTESLVRPFSGEVSDLCWINAVGAISVTEGAFGEILHFFLQPENAQYWANAQDLAAAKNPESDKTIREYVLEAQRLTTSFSLPRACIADVTIDGQCFKRGDTLLLLLGPASRDADFVPEPMAFKPGRPKEAYAQFGWGAHECLGREIAIMFCVELIKLVAGLKNLRPAPGDMGEFKSIVVGQQKNCLSEDWSKLTLDPTNDLEIAL